MEPHGRRDIKLEDGEECHEMLSSVHAMAIAVMSSLQLESPAQDQGNKGSQLSNLTLSY